MTGSDPFDLSSEAAIVTGAGRGIGRAIAHGLAARGADVFLVDIATPTEAVAELRAAYPARTVAGAEADVRDPASAVAHFASPGARYVTGQVIRVCGGAAIG